MLSEKVQPETFGRMLTGKADRLIGYRTELLQITDPVVLLRSELSFHPIAFYTNDPSDFVNGKVFELSREELESADKYEVADYKRIAVQLASGIQAWVYVKA